MTVENQQQSVCRVGYAPLIWHYAVTETPKGVNLFNSQERANWLSLLTAHILSSLAGVAEPCGIEVQTGSPDESSYETRLPTQKDYDALDQHLRETLHVSAIVIWFDLLWVTTRMPAAKRKIMTGWDGWIHINNYIGKDGEVEFEDGLITVNFEFHNVIYGPEILSDEYLRKAELDAASLSKFVWRLGNFPGLKLRDVDCDPNYSDWLRSYGLSAENDFKLPDSACPPP